VRGSNPAGLPTQGDQGWAYGESLFAPPTSLIVIRNTSGGTSERSGDFGERRSATNQQLTTSIIPSFR